MSLIDIDCSACQRVSEVSRPVADWPATPPCPHCGGATTQIFLPRAPSQTPPVVVYRMPDGSFRFPGDPDGRSAAHYRSQGGERLELRGFQAVRRFEHEMNAREYQTVCRRIARQQALLEAGEARRRADFHHGLHAGFQVPELAQDAHGHVVFTGRTKTVHLGPRARDLAHQVMARNNQRRPQAYDPGFRVECYSENRGSRLESRDPSGHKRRD